MMLAYVMLFKWMLASVSCLLAGALVWAVLVVALRRWPALLPRRALWLAAQAVTAGAALLALLPHSPQQSLAPTVTLSAAESSAIRTGLPALAGVAQDGVSAVDRQGGAATGAAEPDAAAGDIDPPSLTLLLPALWTLVYAAGLAWMLARRLRARRVWRGLLATSQRLSPQDLLAHGAFDSAQLADIARHRLTVMETDAAISPMLVGVRRPVLLLPRHLRGFSTEQQHMVIAHELHHWRARDPLCLGVAALLQTVFWFNPALRWMNAKMEWALELICDQRVLAGRPQQQRKQYAAALLLQWKAQTAAMPTGGVAFGGIDGATAAARIRQMQQAALPVLSSAVAWSIAALMIAVLAGGAMLQPAVAFNTGQQPYAVPVPAQVPPPAAASIEAAPEAPAATEAKPSPADAHWRYPLDKMRVTGLFGVRRTVLVTPHKGIDIAAPAGTPVHAVAGGVVVSAGVLTENGGRYGKTVILQHGAQRTLYAHLTSMNVKAGATVEAGQQIGTVGETGFATGPHLHFEVRQDEEFINPATKLANLDAYTTKRALRLRQQQQGY
ncbi:MULTISPECIES: M23/M56 family metallopeptidase [unclassified Duganella]|uniref:M23/M56 family metallopeptidase n=1 Tax=unclassified Duganella TaxID=2636909 RepID=UPI000E3555C2|nr:MULTISPECIES: M23/M56 family metallopeptidase [unclassified Duganella]RFP16157.1 peptidase [Duganella sp. BJB475]RFP32680.1 peptidase [Duganella sp. BJB476]